MSLEAITWALGGRTENGTVAGSRDFTRSEDHRACRGWLESGAIAPDALADSTENGTLPGGSSP